MTDNEYEDLTPHGEGIEPKKGEMKMVRVRRDGQDRIELLLFNGMDWVNFEEFTDTGDEA
jgi:hypothetical protein